MNDSRHAPRQSPPCNPSPTGPRTDLDISQEHPYIRVRQLFGNQTDSKARRPEFGRSVSTLANTLFPSRRTSPTDEVSHHTTRNRTFGRANTKNHKPLQQLALQHNTVIQPTHESERCGAKSMQQFLSSDTPIHRQSVAKGVAWRQLARFRLRLQRKNSSDPFVAALNRSGVRGCDARKPACPRVAGFVTLPVLFLCSCVLFSCVPRVFGWRK
jgi:hypothetical protein